MIYFYLAFLSAVFTLLGFFVHAFCFANSAVTVSPEEIESLHKALREKEGEARIAQEEIIKTGALVRSLEQQIEERSVEVGQLQRKGVNQGQQISSLQEKGAAARLAAEKIQAVPKQSTGGKSATTGRRESPSMPLLSLLEETPYPPVEVAAQKASSPIWRENLNNIIDILDAMEKDVKK
jgi:septal ring factor EnvC (AmiA/AmiB activator)